MYSNYQKSALKLAYKLMTRLYYAYKRNLITAHKNVPGSNSIKSTHTIHPTYSQKCLTNEGYTS